jgi:hypothetical protein
MWTIGTANAKPPYDNKWGYACRLTATAAMIAQQL